MNILENCIRTVPDIKDFEKIFQELSLISKKILQCSDTDLDNFQYLMDQREPLLDWLVSNNNPRLSVAEKEQLQEMIKEIQSADNMIESKFRHILMSQANALCQINRAKDALSCYKFPYTTNTGGLENEG